MAVVGIVKRSSLRDLVVLFFVFVFVSFVAFFFWWHTRSPEPSPLVLTTTPITTRTTTTTTTAVLNGDEKNIFSTRSSSSSSSSISRTTDESLVNLEDDDDDSVINGEHEHEHEHGQVHKEQHSERDSSSAVEGCWTLNEELLMDGVTLPFYSWRTGHGGCENRRDATFEYDEKWLYFWGDSLMRHIFTELVAVVSNSHEQRLSESDCLEFRRGFLL